MSITSIAGRVFLPRQRELERHNDEGVALQRKVLEYLTGKAADTEFGRRYAFGRMQRYEDFASRVPVGTYEDFKDSIDRMRHGESDVLWPGRVKWYAKSSGTTNDKSKFIPVSREGLHKNHYAGSFDVVALYLRNNPGSRLFDGRALILGGSHAPNYNLPGSLVGDLSAILIENINPLANLVRVPRKQTALLSDFEVKRDRIAREAMGKNVTNLSGVPSWMLSVLSRVMELSGRQHLEEVWPNLEVFFHGGVAFTPYRGQYDQLITSPRMHYMETYNASEGFFGVQSDSDDRSMLLLLDDAVFYEFQEVGSTDVVPLEGVETGRNYAMIISTACGLWRYMLGDTVRFTQKNPYKFVITGRTKHFINAFGEELIVDNAEQGLDYACQQTGAQVSEYTAAPVFMDERGHCRHQWLVEFARRPDDVGTFAHLLDQRLQQVNSDYEAKRYKDITLQPLELIEARPGLFNDWLRLRGKLGGQHKVPRLSNTREYMDQLLQMNRASGGLLTCLLIFFCCLFASCANMGNPDGGWFDDTPPRVVGASPADKATNVRAKKIAIMFNEYIKLEDAQNKVIVSPPQIEQAEIRAAGKRIVVELKDSLKANTTYTVDFSDAISDNNEGNPMGNYTYSFSTGAEIDTFEVSGYVLNAEDLEPVKGMLVGLYDNLSDTIFRKEPMIRVSRTDSRGHFTVKGVAPGQYRCYALQDADGDFVYNQKSEMIAFNSELYSPSSKPDIRQDTVWLDTLHIDRILRVPYTHFLPDDITLLAFTAPQTDRYLLKNERLTPEKINIIFTYGHDELPKITGLNFNADSAFVVDPSVHRDTIYYWLRDSALINQDTLRFEMQFMKTDSTGMLVAQTDTIEALPKVSYEKRMKELKKEEEKWLKEQEKAKKRGEPYDSVMRRETQFEAKLNASGSIDPDANLRFELQAPLARCDTSAIHLYAQHDTLWYRVPYALRPVKGTVLRYELRAEWEPGIEYSLELDSAAMQTIYGLTSKKAKIGLKVRGLDEYSTLTVNLTGVSDTGYVVQLLDKSGKVMKRTRADADNVAEFFYVKPSTYYLSAFHDRNGNGRWDPGDYDAGLQAEEVYYYSEETECKEKWDVTRNWNLTARRRFEQKPSELIKTKAEQQKKLQNRNLQRAKQLGIEYLKDKGVNVK